VGPRLVVPPKKQHTVSQVVLRRFALHGNIRVYDRAAGRFYSQGPGSVFRSYFDQVDPTTAEARWGAIESRVPAAYRLLDQRRPPDEQAAATLRDLLAMHWARSAAMRRAHEQVGERVVAQRIDERSRQPEFLATLFRQRTGLEAAGPEGLDWINGEVHRRALKEIDQPLFSAKVAEYFELARVRLARWQLEIGYVEAGADLMIGDAPVITLRPGHAGVGPHQDVAFQDATSFHMPISPTIVIGLAAKPSQVSIDAQRARALNEQQLRGFVRWIGWRPGGPSDRAMGAAPPPSRLPGSA